MIGGFQVNDSPTPIAALTKGVSSEPIGDFLRPRVDLRPGVLKLCDRLDVSRCSRVSRQAIKERMKNDKAESDPFTGGVMLGIADNVARRVKRETGGDFEELKGEATVEVVKVVNMVRAGYTPKGKPIQTDNPSGYVYTAAYYRLLDKRKKESENREFASDGDTIDSGRKMVDDSPGTYDGETWMLRECPEVAFFALSFNLPAKEREVIYHHFFEGMTTAETAKKLGVPESTIKSRIQAARKRLLEEKETVRRIRENPPDEGWPESEESINDPRDDFDLE